jgi:hypothetical protein
LTLSRRPYLGILPFYAVPFYWKQILEDVMNNNKRVLIQKRAEWEALGSKQAAELHCEEKTELRERIDGEHPDFEPDEAPRS